MPYDFDLPHLMAVGLIFLMWAAYGPILSLLGRGTLNAQLHVVRLRWMRMLLNSPRENRVIDAIMLGQLSNSMSFFGSATLILLAGLVGTLASINHVHASLTTMSFFPPMSLGVFSMIPRHSRSSWRRRSFLHLCVAQARLRAGNDRRPEQDTDARTPHCTVMIAQTAVVLTKSVKSLNNGHSRLLFRGVCIVPVRRPLRGDGRHHRRQRAAAVPARLSTKSLAIERYVAAMNDLEVEAEREGKL